MVIRWNHVATLVVVTLTVIHCEQINFSQVQVDADSIKVEDLCPCLPVDICPRVFGTKPEDARYLGEIMKCDDDNKVRCCGASASFVVGKNEVTTEASKVETTTTRVPQPNILSILNSDDVHENEISDAENGSEVLTSTLGEEHAEVHSIKIAENVANFHSQQRLNGETDEEAAESESIVKTANIEQQHEHQPLDGVEGSTEEGESNTEVISPAIAPKSHRKPKHLDSVMMVYPNSMSGIPKTTPRNMPETNEMTMFDQEIGMDLHLVFSKTTMKPELPVIVESGSTKNSIKKQPRYQFAKRQRQYKPISRVTTESPVEDVELKPTTVRNRNVTTQSSRVRNFNLKPSTEETTDSTVKPQQANNSTMAPITEQEEILHTSDDDKSQQNRFRLFNARHRLNYLQRSTTTTTTESPIEIPTRHSQSQNLDKKRPLKVDDSSSKIPIRRRPSKMNETLVRIMDTNHRNMMSKVRVALKAASTENQISEIPRSFASVDMNNRVKKIEKMLVSKMIDVYTETKSKRLRGDQPKTKEPSNVRNNLQNSTITEVPAAISTSNSTRPYRGEKKFQMADLLDKTLIVPMNTNEFRRMRVRSTTAKPTVEQILEDDIVTTTRRSRRRPTTTTVQPNVLVQTLDEKKSNNRDSSLPVNNEGRNFRRRVSMRRRFTVEPSPSTTVSPPAPTTSEIIPTHSDLTIETTNPTISTISTKATATPETTSVRQPTTEPAVISNISKDDFQEELQEELVNESLDELTQTLDIEHVATTIIPSPKENSDSLSDFKPSPLWSISSDEKTDFNDRELNHSYVMDGVTKERTLRNGSRRSRTTHTFQPSVQYLNGFVPVTSFAGPVQIVGPIPKSSKLGNDVKVKYNLPRDSKAHFSKN